MLDFPPQLVPTDYFRRLTKTEIFPGENVPLEIDLGCGDGRFLEQMAALYPERHFLGVERLLGRVDKTARRIARLGLRNARVLRMESSYTVGWLLPERSVSRLHLLCPDPWPKAKHLERRLINEPEFLEGLEKALEIGGEFLLKTDDEPYFENALAAMEGRGAMEKIEWPEDAFPYPRTSFEKQWLEQGKVIWRARWKLAPR
jgi:tRNA (guanine-N7-)-methyltransferase